MSCIAIDKIRETFPLAQYSARYWMSHAAVAEGRDMKDMKLQGHVEKFVCDHRSSYRNCYSLYRPDDPYLRKEDLRKEPPLALYYASFGGLVNAVQVEAPTSRRLHTAATMPSLSCWSTTAPMSRRKTRMVGCRCRGPRRIGTVRLLSSCFWRKAPTSSRKTRMGGRRYGWPRRRGARPSSSYIDKTNKPNLPCTELRLSTPLPLVVPNEALFSPPRVMLRYLSVVQSTATEVLITLPAVG